MFMAHNVNVRTQGRY
uniref:Uncharacterized protein n=1 Tax=Anguilla anguilla TaxID=7936 RepID=A0A0E9SEK1_ANGAN